ncbi:DUF2254 domain-containing protein [Ramlibacter sp. AN1015]|uniref:DUF2254 domain-containing protein n=1 Tax=Ramlibacter sp. AN1015 TaxID=3133428 RepID=UPI0030C1762B
MILRLRALWSQMQSSFWFVPALIVAGSLLVAVGLIYLEGDWTDGLAEWSPRLFGASADGSREMLGAIAASMITVAGVVFSITIVTLSLTSTQYSPRVLRNFMRDRPTQVVLGVFVGIFAYCLVVMRTVRGEDSIAFVPSLAVLGGLLYALVGIALLIYYIHHVAQSIQAPAIMRRLASDTARAIDELFPSGVGQSPEAVGADRRIPSEWVTVRAEHSGYLTQLSGESLMDYAREESRVVWLCHQVGDFVSEGAPLVAISGHRPIKEDEADRLRKCVMLGTMRTVDQDVRFGLSQLVDVAVRALSPGMNDVATACMCVDRLGSLMARLASRFMPSPLRFEEDELRVIAPAPGFDDLLLLAFEPIVRHSRGERHVLERVMDALGTIGGATSDPQRRAALMRVVRELQLELQLIQPRARSRELRSRLRTLERSL